VNTQRQQAKNKERSVAHESWEMTRAESWFIVTLMNNAHYVQVRIAAVLGALAVVLGAMGAHGRVHDLLVETKALEHWQTATHYHLVHAVALLTLGLAGWCQWGWRLMALGTGLFSGSLYVLAITGEKWLGRVTPIGGLCLIVGWLLVAARADQDSAPPAQ
jgi:uncharacterized membrane protein YgdD (TMEM256/DUF423 family)